MIQIFKNNKFNYLLAYQLKQLKKLIKFMLIIQKVIPHLEQMKSRDNNYDKKDFYNSYLEVDEQILLALQYYEYLHIFF